jgi:hypothetical protein
MKAYMSDLNRRTGIYKRLAAIDEAKRILADVEPFNGSWPYWQPSKLHLAYPSEASILAKALESFIATLDKMGH